MQSFEDTALNPYLDGLYPNSIDGAGPRPEAIIAELTSRVEILDRNFAAYQAAMERAQAASKTLLEVAGRDFATIEKDPAAGVEPDIGLIATQLQGISELISETEGIREAYQAAQSEMKDEPAWRPKYWGAIFSTPSKPQDRVGDSADRDDPRVAGAREVLDAARSALARQDEQESTVLTGQFDVLLQARRDIEMLLLAAELWHDLRRAGTALATADRVAKALNARFSEAIDRIESARQRFTRPSDGMSRAPITDPRIRNEIATEDGAIDAMIEGIDSVLTLIRAVCSDPTEMDPVKKDTVETILESGRALLHRVEAAHEDFTFLIRDSRPAPKSQPAYLLQYMRKLTGISKL